ncbi:MAG: hypothetical protein QE284_20185 [Rhizobium sp.]|nr:hypothetical protein [Rhizobium sp.]
MPRYFFHVREHGVLSHDPNGMDMDTDNMAYEEAVKAAREMLSEKVRKGIPIDGQVFEITNASGEVIHILPFKSVLSYG